MQAIEVSSDTPKRRPLVVFEGMDGSGKSTLARAVSSQLDGHLLSFPSHDGEVGKLIRRSFTGEITLRPDVIAHLMIADGMDFVPRIEAVLQGRMVVCDRHTVISGWVYQTELWPVDTVLAMQQRYLFTPPDVAFILDVPEEVAEARIAQRGAARNPMYERPEAGYTTTLRRRYLAYHFMHPGSTILLDGTLPLDELVAGVKQVLTVLEQRP